MDARLVTAVYTLAANGRHKSEIVRANVDLDSSIPLFYNLFAHFLIVVSVDQSHCIELPRGSPISRNDLRKS